MFIYQKYRVVCYLCVCAIFFSSTTLKAENVTDSIVIIFNKMPHYATRIEAAKNIFVGNNDPVILIIDNFHNSFYQPDSTKTADTLKLIPSLEYIMLKHSFNTISFMYYLFKKGDTVIFNYKNNIPVATVINRRIKKYDINYELMRRNKTIDNNQYTPYEIFLNPFFADNKADQDDIVNSNNKVKNKNYYLAQTSFLDDMKFLDSVKKAGDISNYYYLFYIDKDKYLAATIGAEQLGISPDNARKIMPPSSSFQLPYSFYFNFINRVITNTVVPNVKIIFQSNGQIADYRQVFDVIEKDTAIKPPYKDLLLYQYLFPIANNFPYQDFESYFNKFQKITNDSFLIADIKKKYPPDLSRQDNSLSLISLTKDTFNLSDIIATNKGKLIYVDFWASWCVPCRAAMPASVLLRKKYKEKNITFVYLSIDREFKSWLKGNTDEGLEQYPDTYLILNPQVNKFLKKTNMAAIPRYLLYNKKGILINQNAPSPSSKEIEKLIDKYLKQ